jgi:hypothetical protein
LIAKQLRLDDDPLRCELGQGQLGEPRLAEDAREPEQRPVAVHGGVPVVAAVEHRVPRVATGDRLPMSSPTLRRNAA